MRRRKRFGEILLEVGAITEKDLARALKQQNITKQPLGQIFEQLGIISERDILRILAQQFNLKEIDRIRQPAQLKELTRIVDSRTALTKKVFPLSVEAGKLYLATCNPLDLATMDSIAFQAGLQIIPCLATPTEIDRAIRRYYFDEPDLENALNGTILVVDDQKLYRKTIEVNLQKAGYAVLTAANGTDALKIVLSHRPHLVLLETTLQDMSGKEVFRSLQHNNATRQIPVIGLSKRSNSEEEALLLDMGFFDYIAKPFNVTRLMARIRRSLSFSNNSKRGNELRPETSPKLPAHNDILREAVVQAANL